MHKQLIQIMFTPTQEKIYAHKFQLTIKDNSKILYINLKGVGQAINLDFKYTELRIGPVLPYDAHTWQVMQITNTSDNPTEVFSVDFDA